METSDSPSGGPYLKRGGGFQTVTRERMPKRKAVDTLEGSDGEQEEYYSFPSTPLQSPFPKGFPNNVHLPSSPKKSGFGGGSLPSFSFGCGPLQQQQSGVKFGNDAPSSNAVSSTSSFISKLPTINVTAFGESVKKPVLNADNKSFSIRMKDLNRAFISSCRKTYSKSPSHSLIPLVKDYLHHSRVLMEQHRKGASSSLTNGINPEVKSFKFLGEFFEEFEQNYISLAGNKTGKSGGIGLLLGSGGNSSDLTSNSSTLSSATSEKSNSFSSSHNASPSSTSPSTLDNNGKTTPLGGSPLKGFNNPSSTSFTSSTKLFFGANPSSNGSIGSSSSPFGLKNDKNKDSSPLTFPKPTIGISSSTSPILSQTLGAGIPKLPATSTSTPIGGSPAVPSPSSTTGDDAAKPAAASAFKGFSFFATPPVSSTLSFNSANSGPSSTTEKKEEGGDSGGDKNEDENEPSDEPPKVEVVQVKEEDALYSKRCKVFGVVEGKPKDKGIGMLYVKKTEGGKHQVVVRADNNLGTVILNILLQKSLPLNKNSKNSVMTVDLGEKGMPIILKVKSEDDATELLDKLKHFQQLS